MNNINKYIVFSILVVNGVFGKPIPQDVGVPEILIALLMLILLARSFSGGILYDARAPYLMPIGFWLIIVPTVVGALFYQYQFNDFIRDFIPLIFLLIPIILWGQIIGDQEGWRKFLELGFFISGVALSIRQMAFTGQSAFSELTISSYEAPMNQCPTVVYTAVAATVAGLVFDYSPVRRMIVLGGGLICLAGLGMIVMRAQVFIVLISIATCLIFSNTATAKKNILISAIVMTPIIAFYFNNILEGVYWTIDLMSQKTDSTGGLANSRDEELNVIYEHVTKNVANLFFGSGWGASMYVPTADAVVRFTHIGALFFLWKSGIFGLLCVGVYFRSLMRNGFLNILNMLDPGKNYSVIGILSGVFVFGTIEMGYKMLTFGLSLLMVLSLNDCYKTKNNKV